MSKKKAPDPKFLLRDKTERFIADLYIALRRYPKSERHVLAAETRMAAYRLLRHVLHAGKVSAKRRALEAADSDLAMVSAFLRIGMELNYLQFPSYERLARSSEELGRMLGGWIKKSK